ncbi:MAG: protein-disulfide reductase DsbD family protein [Thermoanaerobaculia bacterium]
MKLRAGAAALAAAVAASVAVASGPTPATSPPSPAAKPVVTAALAATAPVRAAGAGEIVVTLTIADGYHVMSDRPSSEFYIATRVRFPDADGVAFAAAIYPPPREFSLSGRAIATFEGEVRVRLPFTVAAGAAPGERELHGELSYQACTRSRCLFPVKAPLVARISVAP